MLAAAAGFLFTQWTAGAAVFSEIGSFPPWGGLPQSELIEDAAGNLYGTTYQGGVVGSEFTVFGYGTVYRISPQGVLSTLASFGGSVGINPVGGLAFGPDGHLYGTASAGGDSSGLTTGAGTVFRVTLDGRITAIHQFGTGQDGGGPRATLLLDPSGDFYGTSAGGLNSYGTIFRISPAGDFSTLYRFTGGADGMSPQSKLVRGSDGRLYGTTAGEGRGLVKATVFRILGNQLTTLHTFAGQPTDGAGPLGGLVQGTNGTFYGTTSKGGIYDGGTLYSIRASGDYAVLTSLAVQGTAGGPGYNPLGTLVFGQDGALYGTASKGGNFELVTRGTIFRAGTTGGVSSIHRLVEAEGSQPVAGLLASRDGSFYGTASEGGLYGKGSAFRVRPDGTLTMLASFGEPPGSDPRGLCESRSGDIYGTTYAGGRSNLGTIFRLSGFGVMTALATFVGTNGALPPGRLTEGTNGHFYGVTTGGGKQGRGTVFKITPQGALSTLVQNDLPGGIHPVGDLWLAGDGNFYGVTRDGGAFDFGTIFRMDHAGRLETVQSFQIAHGSPAGGVIEGPGGDLYGVTGAGATHQGAVYRLSKSGVLTLLGEFNGSNGAFPSGRLLLDGGAFYGTAEAGGPRTNGVVFKLIPGSPISLLAVFNQTNGAAPMDGLIRATDGNYYGTTKFGSTNNTGSVFRLTPGGTLSTILAFNQLSFNASMGPTPGAHPITALLQSADGTLLGTTSQRGAHQRGNVFRLDLGLPPTVPPGPIQLGPPVFDALGRLVIDINGPTREFSIQVSSNLVHWSVLASRLTPTNGHYHYVDPRPPGRAGFYKVSIP